MRVPQHHSGRLPFQLVFFLLLSGLALGCGGGTQDANSGQTESAGEPASTTLGQLQASKHARVGFANEAPFAYLDPDTNELTGEAPEIARHVLGELGITDIEGVLVEFGSLIPGLKAGRFDFIAAGMYITPERCKQVLFSEPTYCVGEAFLVKAGNPANLHSFEAVKANPRARLGVVSGTVEVGYAQKLGIPDSQLVRFPDMSSAAAGVTAGRADAFAGTSLTVNDLLGKMTDSGLERAAPFINPIIDGAAVRGCGAFAFRPEDTALQIAFDQQLAAFIGSEAHVALIERFGFARPELPTGVTRDALCAPASPQAPAKTKSGA